MTASCGVSAQRAGFLKSFFMAAVRLGTKRLAGRHLLPHEFVLNLIVDRLVRTKVRARLGGQLKYFISGGAASTRRSAISSWPLASTCFRVTGRRNHHR